MNGGILSPYTAATCAVFTISDSYPFDHRVCKPANTLFSRSTWWMKNLNWIDILPTCAPWTTHVLVSWVGVQTVQIRIIRFCGHSIRASAWILVEESLFSQISAPRHKRHFS